ncbi:transglutaminase superfamily protein [Paenibacillus cellulosilyticus]|uniref:Transglutaminase superfamily protein n=1 Tax=Paenibacillus cellulosilyticus TaxID=375489 RepID=A0A2V2YYN5_9BACL|nr:transglutaminase domain-containing protein [Paenibacillus cellulosilyticus]PWV98422.1 transglutaminase superfamily protein [Paenibacillus cellulosilyticus]QKS43269.1 hypothetical protein HUB94_01995 [Paenibacillus cellulosilyticus]
MTAARPATSSHTARTALSPSLFARMRSNLRDSWYRRIASLMTAIIIWQLTHVFEGYWWEETFSCVQFVLISTVVLEWFIPWRTPYRMLLQAVVLVIASGHTAGYSYIKPESLRSLSHLWTWIVDNATQLNPFIGIAALAWGMLAFFTLWATTRKRIIVFTAASLLSLMIADSYTLIYLWDQTAWAIFASLAWLVADHYSRFQREHPNSWSELLEYPISFLLPVVAIIAGIMVLGILTPSVAPIMKDPYTMWAESHGKKVIGSYTDDLPVIGSIGNTPTGDTSSGYSRNDLELGGGFQFDYSTVMFVNTSHRSYWRGETRSEYTGSGWAESQETAPADQQFSGLQSNEELPLADDRSKAKMIEITQAFTMVKEEEYPVLFAAAPARQLRWFGNVETGNIPSGLTWNAAGWELLWPMGKNEPYPKTYSVVSELPVLNSTALKETTAGWGAADPQKSEHQQYYNLPQTVTSRVGKLAEQITAGSSSDYEKALRLQTYLKDNFAYTNEPDTSLRTSSDFVDSFLFEVKEGYCDYFSTAMAVLGRSVGLPVRWVKGYAPGVLPINEDEMRYQGFTSSEAQRNPNGAGTYTVRNADAHSWVEIYFNGFGWIPFEATPGFDFPYPVEDEQAVTVPDVDLSDMKTTPVVEAGSSFFTPRAVMWYSIAILAVLLVYAWFRRRQLADSYTRIRYRATNANERIVVETNRLVRFARRKGLQREDWETVREASERWAQERTYLRADLKVVADCFERAKYGTTVYEQDEVDRFLSLVRSIRDRM